MTLSKFQLDEILQKYVATEGNKNKNLRAAALTIIDKNGDILYERAFGKTNFDTNSPSFTEDSVCWIASLTKLLTAVCVMQLVEKGLVKLDDDLGKIVPELANKEILCGFDETGKPVIKHARKAITLKNLLIHSSGFCYAQATPDIVAWSTAVNGPNVKHPNKLKDYDFPLLFEPDSNWEYGCGTDWAGHAVEVISKLSLEDYMRQNIFDPLEMSSSTFYLSEYPELAARLVTIGFRPSPEASLSGPVPHEHNVASENPGLAGGGSGLYSTMKDYSKILKAVLVGDQRILNQDSMNELFKPQLVDTSRLQAFCDGPFHIAICPEFPRGLPVNYCLGGAMNLQDVPDKRRSGSIMWCGVSGSRWWIDPTSGIAATLFTQILPFGDPVIAKVYDEVEREVYKGINAE